MRNTVWRGRLIEAPPERIRGVRFGSLEAGRATADPAGSAVALPSASEVRSQPMVWSRGRTRGTATVELHPASSWATEVVVRVVGPRGMRGQLWTARRLARLADALLGAASTQVLAATDRERGARDAGERAGAA